MSTIEPVENPQVSSTSIEDSIDLRSIFAGRSRAFSDRLALRSHGHPEETFTYGQLAQRGSAFAGHLLASGLNPSDRVALLSESRPRLGITVLSVLAAGSIAVPLDPSLTEHELLQLLTDAQPRWLIVSAAQVERGRRLQRCCPSIQRLYCLDPVEVNASLPSMDAMQLPGYPKPRWRQKDQPALLVYSSGSTSQPKGVLITYGNLMQQIEGYQQTMQPRAGDMHLSILPLNHLFELVIGFLAPLYAGAGICYVDSLLPEEITAANRACGVRCMLVVPLFLDLLRKGVLATVRQRGRLQRWLFATSLMLARFLSNSGRRQLFRQLHRQLGPDLEYFICGGAPLDGATQTFFERLGIRVYQGYGLTETGPVISSNLPGANKSGSVGRPGPGIELRIAGNTPGNDVGEILTRGDHVMKGYYRQPELSQQAIDDEGWFHTGDLGRIDNDGFLYVLGRCNNQVALGNGKKVQPEEIEAAVNGCEDIAEFCVLGLPLRHGSNTRTAEDIHAVVVPSRDAVMRFSGDANALADHLRRVVYERCRDLADWKRPRHIHLREQELPKSSTRKVRRNLLRQILQQQVPSC